MFQYDDGGREDAGYKGGARDCVTRAIAIALRMDYEKVRIELMEGASRWRLTSRSKSAKAKRSNSVRNGVPKEIYRPYIESKGWIWTPTMGIGTGCTVHLVPEELPGGRLIVRVSKHLTAVIDGVIHDTHNPQREVHCSSTVYVDGEQVQTHSIQRRCVYGYFADGATEG